jgi:1-acyl-sn-glycerol-3-phosphate acyltransferase
VPRAVRYLPLFAVYTLALGLAGIVCGVADPRGRLARRMAVVWGRLVLRAMGVDLVVSGVGNAPAGPAVYAANHGSALDIPMLAAGLPVDFRFIHKRSLYFAPVIGQYLWAAGHIGIDRGNPFRARKSLERAAARIRAGASVVSFPEGTRSADETVRRFKRGTFVLAVTAGVPVVPVSLSGVKGVAPGGLGVYPGAVRMTLHPPVPTAGRSVEEAGLLAEEVRGIVAAGCAAA